MAIVASKEEVRIIRIKNERSVLEFWVDGGGCHSGPVYNQKSTVSFFKITDMVNGHLYGMSVKEASEVTKFF